MGKANIFRRFKTINYKKTYEPYLISVCMLRLLPTPASPAPARSCRTLLLDTIFILSSLNFPLTAYLHTTPQPLVSFTPLLPLFQTTAHRDLQNIFINTNIYGVEKERLVYMYIPASSPSSMVGASRRGGWRAIMQKSCNQ